MNKEQIMINGVDVSGCEYIGFGKDGTKSVYPCQIMLRILPPGAADCRNFPKCQFRQLMKQLARKTQECERLGHYVTELIKYLEETANILGLNTNATILGKNALEYWAVLTSSSNSTIKKLQQECEELKKEKAEIKKYLGISDKSILQRLEELTEYKLKSQLEYIKKLEENDSYRKAIEEIEEFCITYSDNHDAYETVYKYILNIINRAKGEE